MTSGVDRDGASEYRRGLFCAIVSVVLVSIAQLTMKYGMAHVSGATFSGMHTLFAETFTLSALCSVLTTLSITTAVLPVAVGIFCYAVSVLCWMGALGRLPLNLAYPLLSLSYPLVYSGAALLPFFNEALNTQRIIGIGFIMLGVVLLMIKSKTTE
jgi:undecaprenyl phosphate-alpha-L-ara4N flippase subunit ArnF